MTRIVKLFLASLVLAISARASTVIYPLTNWVSGVSATNSIKLTPVGNKIGTDGSYSYIGPSIWLTGTTNGLYTNQLNGGNWEAKIIIPDDWDVPPVQPILFGVPFNDTNTWTLQQLQISGGSFFVTRYITNIFFITNVPNAITNANAGANTTITTNGQSITISSTGSPLAITNLNPGDIYESFATNLHSVTLTLNASTFATGNTLVARDGFGYGFFNGVKIGAGFITVDGSAISFPSGGIQVGGGFSSDNGNVGSDGSGNMGINGSFTAGGHLSFDLGAIGSDGSGNLGVTSLTIGSGSAAYVDLHTGVLQNSLVGTLIDATGYGTFDSLQINQSMHSPPVNSTDDGNTGQIAWDSSYIYVCIAPNTWVRAALSSW